MKTLFIEGGDYTGIVIMILIVMLLPAIIMTIIGFSLKKRNQKPVKRFL